MSEELFPTLRGLTWDTKRRPTFSTSIAKHKSGKEVRSPDYPYPIWQFELTYEYLPQNRIAGVNDLYTLMGFFLERGGAFDNFLFQDPSDSVVEDGAIGVGDGTTTDFPFVRTIGGFIEPVGKAAPAATVRKNGVVTAAWTYSDTKRAIRFTTAPAAGVVITADFTFYHRVRFSDDTQEYNEFMDRLWDLQQCSFQTDPV